MPPGIEQQRDRDHPDDRSGDRWKIAEHPLQIAPVHPELIEAADRESDERHDEGGHRVTAARKQQQRADDRTPYPQRPARIRSEEHPAELQSLMRNPSTVFCLKKIKQQPPQTSTTLS